MKTLEDLRWFQKEDLPFFLESPKSLILYEPRMGKTVEAMSIVGDLATVDLGNRSILVICPTNALLVWEDHVNDWLKEFRPELMVEFRLVRGTPSGRMLEWKRPIKPGYTFFVTTQASFLRDVVEHKLPFFHTIFIDEYHKWLSRETKSVKALKPVVRAAHRFHPMSGTPVDRDPRQFFTILQMCDHKVFSSKYAFYDRFFIMNQGQFAMEYCGLKNPPDWFKMLSQWTRIRFRTDTDMPKLQRARIHYEMNADQLKLYQDLEEDSFSITDAGEVIVAATSVERTLRLRQLLTCPQILDQQLGVGAAMENLGDTLADFERPEDKHVAIFTSFRKALEPFKTYMQAKLQHGNVFLLHGGLEPKELQARIQGFQATKGVIICTTKYAQAFSLAGASACYHIGWEWSPNDNKQAEDRIIPQKGPEFLNSFYYACKGTVEDEVANVVVMKDAHVAEGMGRT